MKVIMLLGVSNIGKTTTINEVYNALAGKNGENIICPKTGFTGSPKDFECVLKYKEKQIALFSLGDLSREVTQAMCYYDNMKCDILVCACNINRLMPQRYLARYPGSQIIQKSIANQKAEEYKENKEDANKIISLIQKMI